MLSGLEPSFMCNASLSFPLGPPVYVCATLLWGQEGRVHCRVTGCWVCSPGPLSPASSLSEALHEIELLDLGQLAVWWCSWGFDTPGTPSGPPSTELTSLDTIALSQSVSAIGSHILLQQPWLLAWLTHYGNTHTDCQMVTGKNNKLSMQHCGCKLSPKCEKWNAILSFCKWGPTKKRMADKVLLIAACHHIIAVTLVLRRYTLPSIQLVTHKPEQQSSKNKLCIVANTSLLAVGTNNLI